MGVVTGVTGERGVSLSVVVEVGGDCVEVVDVMVVVEVCCDDDVVLGRCIWGRERVCRCAYVRERKLCV